MSSSLSTSNENSVESMPRGGNPYYSSSQQHQQQYHYQMNQPLNYNNNINNNTSNNINLTLSNANHINYSAPNNNYNSTLTNFQQQQIFNQQQQQQHHNHHNPSSLSSHQHYQHPSIATVFPSIYAESMMSTKNAESDNGGSGTAVAASNSSLSGGSVQSGSHYSTVQKQIQQDWSNREYIEVIISNIKKLTDFLNSFELSCKSKLAMLDEKLTKLERQIDFVEAKVTKGETLN
jgi:uncharacterized protein